MRSSSSTFAEPCGYLGVMQSGFETAREPRPGTATRVGSPVGTTGGAFAYLWIPRERLAAEIAFAIDELAFLAPSAEDYSVMQHGLVEPAFVPPVPLCLAGPGACPMRYIIPLGYLSHTAAISAHGLPKRWLDLGAAVGFEWRGYLAESHIAVVQADGRVTVADRRLRVDDRLFTSAFAGWRLSRSLELGARFEFVLSRSNVERAFLPGDLCTAPDFSCHALDYDNKNYSKNQVTAEVVLAF